MNCEKIGILIKKLRLENNMTQKQLADKMTISDKTVSKWERGLGMPELSLLSSLSDIFNVDIKEMLTGTIMTNNAVEGNMKNTKYYVCQLCDNITICSGKAKVYCCGRELQELKPRKAEEQEKLTIEDIENEWYVTSDNPMTKENYITFVAFMTGDRVDIVKQYPEWNLQARFNKISHGKLLWYSKKCGLLFQNI